MNYISIQTDGLKFVLGWVVVFLIRLIPFRPANFEPLLATMMPYSKKYGLVQSFLFGFLAIVLFDLVAGRVGLWTFITGVSYGLLGVWAFYYFRKRESNIKNYVTFGIMGTLAYDIVTGLSIGPLFFGQSFMSALVGQIPFTLMHLLGTIVFAVVVSPLVHRWIVTNHTLEIPVLMKKIYAW